MRTEVHLASTSSGIWGYSVQSRYLDCSYEAHEHEMSRVAHAHLSYQPEPEEVVLDKKGNAHPTVNNLLVGSAFGELVQQYLAKTPYVLYSPVYWENVPIKDSHATTIALVWEMFRAFCDKHSPDSFGEVIGTEVAISIPEDLFGLPVTGAIDFLSRDGRGLWVNDIKTTSSVDNKEDPFRHHYRMQQQCWLYACGHHIATGEEIAGVRHIIQTRKNSDTYVVESEGLTPSRMRWLQTYCNDVLAQRANIRPQPSSSRCMKYHKPCRFMQDGICAKI